MSRDEALYRSTDIETFADGQGPVWKVTGLHQPGMIAKHNAGEGSIVPWQFDPKIHTPFSPNQRLLNDVEYIDQSDSSFSEAIKS